MPDAREQFKCWLESGEARLQPVSFPQRKLWENSPVPVADPANHICGFIETRCADSGNVAVLSVSPTITPSDAVRAAIKSGAFR